MRELDLLAEANQELEDEVAYLEAQREGLGDRFLSEVDRTMSSIEQMPYTGSLVAPFSWNENEIRRKRVGKFRMWLIYVVGPLFTVVAVKHDRQHPDRWKLAMHHRSAYSACTTHGSYGLVRDAWVPMFDKHGVDVVFAGHNHIYERSVPIRGGQEVAPADGTTYVVSGGAGAPLYTRHDDLWFGNVVEPIEHYVIVDVSPANDDVDSVDDHFPSYLFITNPTVSQSNKAATLIIDAAWTECTKITLQ